MFVVVLITLIVLLICTLPVWKLIDGLLRKFTNINVNLVWVQILIDIPSIFIGYNIAYFLIKLYAKHLGMQI